jgi:hypothetical protein
MKKASILPAATYASSVAAEPNWRMWVLLGFIAQ